MNVSAGEPGDPAAAAPCALPLGEGMPEGTAPAAALRDGWRAWLRPVVVPGLLVGLAAWCVGLLWLAWLAAGESLRLLLAVATRH
jgi:hypothetical protein